MSMCHTGPQPTFLDFNPCEQIALLYGPPAKHAEEKSEWRHSISLHFTAPEQPTLVSPTLDRDGIISFIQDFPSLSEGRHLHLRIIELGLVQDFLLSNLLISMYHIHDLLDDACIVFNQMDRPTIVSWNTLIRAYSASGNVEVSLQLLRHMLHGKVQPDDVTIICVLAGCLAPDALEAGKVVQACAIELGLNSDIKVKNALINMYSKCGALSDACVVFEGMLNRNVISWTAIITAHCQRGNNEECFHLYKLMEQHGVEPNNVTFISVLGACANEDALAEGMRIHSSIVENGYLSDVMVMNALISMYGKCGSLSDAYLLFGNLHNCNVESWNSMICTFSQYGQYQKGLQLFEEMQRQNFKLDKITFLSVLGACTTPLVLDVGMKIHACTVERGLDADVAVKSALVTMYSKCGALELAHIHFDNAYHYDLVLWTAIITGYAQHGCGGKALELFGLMQQEGWKPNSVTFICILSACSHAGLTDEGCLFFNTMVNGYKLIPDADHFSCIIDLLGKAGRVVEAASMISKLLAHSDSTVWRTFLAACRMHGDVKQANWAAEHLLDKGPSDMAVYSLLSNIYAANGQLVDVEKAKAAIGGAVCVK